MAAGPAPALGDAAGPFTGLDAALVDLDGTLVDTLGDFEQALTLALAELGLPAIGRQVIARLIGRGSQHLMAASLEHLGASSGLTEDLWKAYQRHYQAVNGRLAVVYPGVLTGLRRLRLGGLRLACLTNKPQAFAEPLLRSKDLLGFFDLVFGGDAFERKKPDPLPLIEACRRLGTEPGRSLMIGDSSNDAIAARAAGCPVVLSRHGYNHGEPVERAGADALFDRLDAIVWPPANVAAARPQLPD